MIDKAVRLGYGLITNHPFIDGNKRIGTHAMLVLLAINGIELQYDDEELIDLILKIATGQADDRVLHTWVKFRDNRHGSPAIAGSVLSVNQ